MKRRINLFEIQPSEKTAESDKKPVAVKKFQNTAEFELLNPVTMIQHSEPNQFGNKRDYYIKRGTRMSVIDPRLVALDRALFAEKDILDVGCHCGLISLQLGKYFEAKTVKGIDLDYRLINTASTFWIKEERRTHKTEDSRDGDQSGGNAGESSKSVSMNFEDESEEIDLPAPPSKSVAVSMNGVLPPIEPRKKTDKSGYPYNVKFEVCNILQLDTAAVEERYDVIMLLSVTKWIQLNFGDDGIRKLFRVVKSLLKVGGRVVLEPQRFKSYSKLASVCARFQAIYPGITIKPEDYESILVGELGLMKEGTFQSLARDSFKRDIMIYSDMKAIIMAGGYGTRLRPLTMHSPKSVIEFAHSTVFEIQIAALIAAGVQEIMICLAHQAECIEKIVDELRVKYKVKMTLLLQHPTMPPMNALKLAKDLLYIDNPDELFYVCNSDVMTEFPFVEMKQHMTDKSVDLVMCVSKSKTPSLFGVVSCDEQGRVLEFHEKPQVFKGDLVNAGIYLFRNHIADMVVEQDISSILTIFDILMAKKAIKSFQLAHYWMDIGNPRDYLEATKLHLNYLKLTKPEQLTPEVNNHIIGNDLFGNVMIHPSATVDPSAYIGPDVLIGPGAVVGPGVRLKSSVLFSNSKVDASAFVESTILSWRSVIGRHARIHGLTVIAEDVNISNEVFINQAQILPNTSVKENIEKAGQIKLV